jgi:hypothetical protein
MDPEEQLRDLYYSPSTGLASATALYKRAKAAGLKISLAKVKEWVKAQEVSQVFVRRTVKHHFPLVAYRPFGRIQVDLTDMSSLSRWNKGIKYLFLAVDVYTRVAFCVPLKSKGNAEVLNAFKSVIEQIKAKTDGVPPSQVDSDQEASMLSRDYRAYCEENLISQHLLAVADYKGTGVVDRLTRTLRELMNRYMVAYNTKDYLEAIPALIENYNTRVNQGIGTAPATAETSEEYGQKYEGMVRKRIARATAASAEGEYQGFEIGDKVRVLLRKGIFEKGTAQKWSSSTHTVESFEDGLYHVTGRVAGYKVYELLRVGAVEHLPVAAPEAVAALAQEAKEEEVDRRVGRRIAKEGVERNERPAPTDEEKSERAIRGRKQRDLGPYLSH